MKKMTRAIRDSLVYAYFQGFYERFTLDDGFGRTHPTNPAWNEAYDSGANLSDRITRTPTDA